MKTTVTLIMFLTVFSLTTFAQDFPYTILEGHTGYIYSVAFSPDGKTLASGSDDGDTHLWDVNTGEIIWTGRSHSVNSVAFSPDGQTLVCATRYGIYLWDVNKEDSSVLFTEFANSVAFSPDGQVIAGGSFDDTINLWDVNGFHIRTLTGDERAVASVAFSPDGQTLASVSYGWNRVTDNTIRFWDVNTGKLTRTIRTDTIGHGGWDYVSSVVFSPDGRMLASGMGRETYPIPRHREYSGGMVCGLT